MIPVATQPQRGPTAASLSLEAPLGRPLIDLEISNPAFCGPLALLLELIEKRRLPIAEISLAEVTDQYLERMRALVGVDPEILADFLVVAAKLLLIKSRELLPSRPREVDEPDVAAELQQRLLEYRVFREAAEQLRAIEENGLRGYPRQSPAEPLPQADPPLTPTAPVELRAAMVRMMKALAGKGETLALAPRVSITQRIEYLLGCLSARGAATFSQLAGETVEELVATFLALLELLRRGAITAQQDSPFGDIALSLSPIEGEDG